MPSNRKSVEKTVANTDWIMIGNWVRDNQARMPNMTLPEQGAEIKAMLVKAGKSENIEIQSYHIKEACAAQGVPYVFKRLSGTHPKLKVSDVQTELEVIDAEVKDQRQAVIALQRAVARLEQHMITSGYFPPDEPAWSPSVSGDSK